MTPRDFALYDTLNCLAIAVDEAESGRPREAEAAWQAAVATSCSAFPEGSDGDEALGVIVGATEPARTGEPGRALLWNALDATSLAALPAMAGDGPGTAMLLDGLDAAISMLAPALREAMTVISAEIGALAMMAVTA